MKVGARTMAGIPGKSNDRFRGNRRTYFYHNSGQVPIQGDITIAVIYGHQVAIAAVFPSIADGARLGRVDRGSDRNRNVIPVVVKQPARSEWVFAPTWGRCNLAKGYGLDSIRESRNGQEQTQKKGNL